MERIIKYALLVIESNKVLLQAEKDQEKLLLPGGRPIEGEDYLKCLKREVKEELSAEVDEASLELLGTFEDVAADGKSILSAKLYLGKLLTSLSLLAKWKMSFGLVWKAIMKR